MEKEFAKMLIQLFAEEESETTDYEDEETESDNEEDELEDEEETSNDAEESKEETAEEPEKVKSFTQDELNSIVESRINRERKRMDREYKNKLSKYEELAYLTQQGLKSESFEDTLNKSREFYGKQGIKYQPKENDEEVEEYAEYLANKIIKESDSIEEIQSEIDRLLKKGQDISSKEKLVAKNLVGELENRKRLIELENIGVNEEVYNSKEFIEFEKQFNKETPIKDIYELYRFKNNSTSQVENPGSQKSVKAKEKKEFISEAEYDKMTKEEIRANMDLIEKSMPLW